jgi:hypothetical protein
VKESEAKDTHIMSEAKGQLSQLGAETSLLRAVCDGGPCDYVVRELEPPQASTAKLIMRNEGLILV